MTQTLVGMLIGITTSLIAGILLIWKGEQAVARLRKLPTKRRVAVFSRAYILALKGYPYRYLHLIGLSALANLVMMIPLFYAIATFFAFRMDLEHPTTASRHAMTAVLASAKTFSDHVLNPWFLFGLTIISAYVAARIIFIRLPPEVLVPYAYRELWRLRECVAKCGTKKQFLSYIDAEQSVQNIADLRALIMLAKEILGSDALGLANEILAGIADESLIPPSVSSSSGIRS
jgi:hypothetical protein